MRNTLFPLFLVIFGLSFVASHPFHRHRSGVTIVGLHRSAKRAVTSSPVTTIVRGNATNSDNDSILPEFQVLADGNRAFRDQLNQNTPTLLRTLTDEGQAPPFMFIGCSDSRASEGTIFKAQPGTLFTERNIANQFLTTDPNTHAVLAYAVAVLGVKHVIVMGHYGCGGVGAAIASPPSASVDAANGVVQDWIEPIREMFHSSNRSEIIELRERLAGQKEIGEPDISEPGFRALVEENVKAGVKRIASDSIIANHYAALAANPTASPVERAEPGAAPGDVFIHGWVYDIATGEVRDLDVSIGPPGRPIPPAPFTAVANAAVSASRTHSGGGSTTEGGGTATTGNGGETERRCEQLCKAKRFIFGRNII